MIYNEAKAFFAGKDEMKSYGSIIVHIDLNRL